ncbi:MAG: SDR family oxidoreductase [Proteobacteria bacterium]|nr:MAG: SDR family oxidoreductase [Pseudomonadota bacterium]
MKNKVWFITGASKGIGLVLAKKLLQAGYKVAATSRNDASLIKAVGARSDNFLPLAMDLQSEDSVRAAVQACVQTFGGMDSLVNNAGYGLFGTIEELSDEESRENYNVNVFGLLNVLRASLPILREQKSGHIFNISSVDGFAGGFPGVGIYCSTKFAVAGITEGLKEEVELFGIKTTLVYPGYFRTNFLNSGSMVLPKKTIKTMQVEHKTEKGTVIFVKLPDDAEAFTMNYRKLCYWFNNANEYSENYLIQEGNFKLIGLTSEITEEQAKMMVDETPLSGFTTSIEDFQDIMQHLQVYENNPIGKDYNCNAYNGAGSFVNGKLYTMNQAYKAWQEAQSRTGKWLVLFKPND